MRIAIVSDVHGNRRALEAVCVDLKEVAPDLVLHGGDLAANGAHPAEVVDQVKSLGWHGVYGNTDEMLWCPQRLVEVARTHPKLAKIVAAVQEMIPRTIEILGEERLRWLAALPPVYTFEKLTVLHASPVDIWRAPLPSASDTELEKYVWRFTAWNENDRLWTHSSSLRAPSFLSYCSEYGQSQPLV